nr:cation:dicarboxylase symporter family transporter [uncultured Fluviicola sp.]
MNALKSPFSLFWYSVGFILCGLTFAIEILFPSLNSIAFDILRYAIIGWVFVIAFKRRKISLWIFGAMLLGIQFGLDLRELPENWHDSWSTGLGKLSKIFIRMVTTLVAPLIFGTLIVGIAGHGNIKQVGRIGLKSILYFEIVTTFALVIGLAAINISQAGKGIEVKPTKEMIAEAAKKVDFVKSQPKDHILDIFPENFAKSIVDNQVLQIVVFSVIFAIGLSMVQKESHKQTMLNWAESLSEVMFKFTDIVMYLAPIAVFGAIANTVLTSGAEMLIGLAKLVATLYVALIAFVGLVLVPIALIAKIPLKKFIRAVSEPFTIAFSTASSEAALPKALENMEKFGVPKKIVGFVIPTGYSFNLDGTTLYLSMATVFVSQMTLEHPLTIGQQIAACLILMLTSKGVAGVRGASFVILVSTVSEFGMNMEQASIILGVDALMDMARTSVNVLGNCLASAVIARSEGELIIAKNDE